MNDKHCHFYQIVQPAATAMIPFILAVCHLRGSEAVSMGDEGRGQLPRTERQAEQEPAASSRLAHLAAGVRLAEQYVEANCLGLLRAQQWEDIAEFKVGTVTDRFRKVLGRESLRRLVRKLLADSMIEDNEATIGTLEQNVLDVQLAVVSLYKLIGNFSFDKILTEAMTDRDRASYFAISSHCKKVLHEEILVVLFESMAFSEAAELRADMKTMLGE